MEVVMRSDFERVHRKNGGMPRRHIQKQSAGLQIAAIPVIGGIVEQVSKPPGVVAEVRKRQPYVALTLVSGVVHSNKQPFLTRPLPGERQETIPRPVAVPGQDAFEQLPAAFADDS